MPFRLSVFGVLCTCLALFSAVEAKAVSITVDDVPYSLSFSNDIDPLTAGSSSFATINGANPSADFLASQKWWGSGTEAKRFRDALRVLYVDDTSLLRQDTLYVFAYSFRSAKAEVAAQSVGVDTDLSGSIGGNFTLNGNAFAVGDTAASVNRGGKSATLGLVYVSATDASVSAAEEVFAPETDVAPIPLPASVWLMASGFLGLGLIARRRRA